MIGTSQASRRDRVRTIVLVGATGFIGSAVLSALRNAVVEGAHPKAGEWRVRAVARRLPVGGEAMTGVEWVRADLAAPASLRGICDDAEVLLHAASYVGSDEAACEDVNLQGTAALMAEATGAGVERIILMSTAAVYGPGPHRGVRVGEVTPRPVSPASRTRLGAENFVLDVGGVVLRPGLVLGGGDRWVVPALAELLRHVPARWDGGRGLLSVTAVEDLARLTVAAALARDLPERTIHHAGHPTPVRNGDLMRVLAQEGVLPPLPEEDLPWDTCLDRLSAAGSGVSARQFALLAQDHYYRSDETWRAVDCPPGPGPLERLPAAAEWYREHLSATEVLSGESA
ncbi:hypothetical protein N566_25300 [Streptomycetaceae bacterium MP113-05]|nr:hypothetical protein N566_25300 [Streptomycetaceae bacterium MP113-05]